MKKVPGLIITENYSSKRITDIKIEDTIIDELINLFKRFNLTAIEYKPFTRFTIANYLDDLTKNEISKYLNDILRDRNKGCFIISPEKITKKIDDVFLVKLSTAITHLIGTPNYDSMAGKFYARFTLNMRTKATLI